MYCQTPGLVLSLRVYFVLPLSQEEKQKQQQQEEQKPSQKSIITLTYTKLWKGVEA